MEVNIIEAVSLGFVLIIQLVTFVYFLSKLANRVKVCEDSIVILFQNDKNHSSELNLLYEIKGQLDILIKQKIV